MSTAAIQKHLHLYTHFSSVIFVCIISKLKTGLVLAFCLYLTQVCLLIVEVCLVVFLHVLKYMCHQGLTTPCVTTQSFHTCSPDCRAPASASSPCLAWSGQGSSKMWCPSCAVQQGSVRCHGQPPPLLLLSWMADASARTVCKNKDV